MHMSGSECGCDLQSSMLIQHQVDKSTWHVNVSSEDTQPLKVECGMPFTSRLAAFQAIYFKPSKLGLYVARVACKTSSLPLA